MSFQKEFHILFIDDNSPDGTAKEIESLMQEFPDKVFLEKRKGKLGLGTAYIHGFNWSISKGMSMFSKWIVIFPITRKI